MNFNRNFASGIVFVVLANVVGISVRAQQRTVEVKGYVLDSACAFTKNLKKPISRECALTCAKAGSPLVVLTDDGAIYWPISDSMPAIGQNQRLMEFAGKKVTAKGKVFEKGGSRALVIEQIKAVPTSK